MLAIARALGAALTVVASIAVAAFAQAPAAPTADEPWVTLAPFPDPSDGLSGATVNGRLYVFAGLAAGWKPKALVFEYDAATDSWARKKPMALASHHLALTVYGDKIFLFGGFKYPDAGPPAFEPINNAWEYDPASDTWKTLAPMPSKRGATAAAVVDGKIYVIGGAGVTAGSSETAILPARRHMLVGIVEEYDPKTDRWRPRSPLPTPRSHAAVQAVNGKIYVIGGRIGSAFVDNGSNTDLVETYDPPSDSWSRPLERMPTARSAAGSAVWSNRIYVAGGEGRDRQGLTVFGAVEAYDPAANQWKAMPPMPTPRRAMAVGVIGDRLYTISGGGADAMSNQALQLDLVK